MLDDIVLALLPFTMSRNIIIGAERHLPINICKSHNNANTCTMSNQIIADDILHICKENIPDICMQNSKILIFTFLVISFFIWATVSLRKIKKKYNIHDIAYNSWLSSRILKNSFTGFPVLAYNPNIQNYVKILSCL